MASASIRIRLVDDYIYELKRYCKYLQISEPMTLEKPFRCLLCYELFDMGIKHPNIVCSACDEYVDDYRQFKRDVIEHGDLIP